MYISVYIGWPQVAADCMWSMYRMPIGCVMMPLIGSMYTNIHFCTLDLTCTEMSVQYNNLTTKQLYALTVFPLRWKRTLLYSYYYTFYIFQIFISTAASVNFKSAVLILTALNCGNNVFKWILFKWLTPAIDTLSIVFTCTDLQCCFLQLNIVASCEAWCIT